jgi:chromosome segregation protein
MQLKKIKLCGFKSFVDEITIPIEGCLTAIVGPNGCGKSNIIDAIRWVMGESSAKHLRGGSMADVIFNGSATRKAVNTASVELVFDNSDGKIGGAYAHQPTLAIKRQVSREGTSLYSLNGSRCRRKEITDLFLGTGLGARSYAIIEQGTISRIVEAKPDDLRVHIEEAAGISKYKERRHETETRMRHTRENLERLTDLRDEMAKQLKHLQKQAAKAEKYTALTQQQQRYKLELLAMRWQQHHRQDLQLAKKLQAISDEQQRLSLLQQQRQQQLAVKKAEQQQLQQQIGLTQQAHYQLETEIVRLQQLIAHNKKNQLETGVEIKRLQQTAIKTLTDYQQELTLVKTLAQQLQENQAALLIAEQVKQQTHQTQQQLATQQATWQQQWDGYRDEAAQQQQLQQLQQLKITQLNRQNQQIQLRLGALQQQRSELSSTQLSTDTADLEQSLSTLKQQLTTQSKQLKTTQQQQQQQKQQLKSTAQTLHQQQTTLHNLNGKITALTLLQQHASAKDNKKLTTWLDTRQLTNSPQLLSLLTVETGWENALEIVLGSTLHALCIEKINHLFTDLERLADSSLVLIENKPCPALSTTQLPLLIDKITTTVDLTSLLTGIYCAIDLAEAHGLIPQLAAHESIITRQGIWLGSHWLKLSATDSSHSGVLQREQQLRLLKRQQHTSEQQIQQQTKHTTQLEQALQQNELDIESMRDQEQLLTLKVATQTTQISANQAKLVQQQQRLQQIDTEINGLHDDTTTDTAQLADAEKVSHQLQTALKKLATEKNSLQLQQQHLQQQSPSIEQATAQATQQLHHLQAQSESLIVAQKAAEKHSESLQQQQHQSKVHLEGLQRKHQSTTQPLNDEKISLEKLTLKKSTLTARLRTQNEQQLPLATAITTLKQTTTALQQQQTEQQARLEKLRFEQQETQVRQQTIREQLDELAANLDDVLKQLTSDSKIDKWKQSLKEISDKIERLGTINLTALDEFNTQSSRKALLDEQHQDLITALATLAEAIEKIDQETRLRFKATFDKINKGLQEKFPKLFGGGQAYLTLTEPKILESGVNIIARPPGKKNSSIHLLSGGEKALTAVALVFSIFELNPAPFCLLDEVDAPLDDANVGRFSKLVKEMAQSVQFLFISHNKVTMEIAEQLTGVTMKEAGVSRIVAVNINEAVQWAKN